MSYEDPKELINTYLFNKFVTEEEVKEGRFITEEELKALGNEAVKSEVIKFLKENPNPQDADLHKWAEEKQYDVHEIETLIYTFATKYVQFLTGGNSPGKIKKEDIDPEELKRGMEVESEHTPDEESQIKIVLDHEVEAPNKDYYKYLDKMEAEMKGEKTTT